MNLDHETIAAKLVAVQGSDTTVMPRSKQLVTKINTKKLFSA